MEENKENLVNEPKEVQPQVIINNIHHGSNKSQEVQLWSPTVAGLLSFIIPDVGQMYKGKIFAGILWLIFTSIGYAMIIFPGIILHIICIATAASGNPYSKK